MQVLATLRSGRALAALALFTVVLVGLYGAPVSSTGGPLQYLAERPRWALFIVFGWVMGPFLAYASIPLAAALVKPGHAALRLVGSEVVFLDGRRFRIDLRTVESIEVVTKSVTIFQMKFMALKTADGEKYLPLTFLREAPTTICERLSSELQTLSRSPPRGAKTPVERSLRAAS